LAVADWTRPPVETTFTLTLGEREMLALDFIVSKKEVKPPYVKETMDIYREIGRVIAAAGVKA
jgi:hypothetical protein